MLMLRKAMHFAPGNTAPICQSWRLNQPLPQEIQSRHPSQTWTPHQVPPPPTCNQCLWRRQCSLGLIFLSSEHNIPTSQVILGWGLSGGVYDSVRDYLKPERVLGWAGGAGCLYASIAEERTEFSSHTSPEFGFY